jgi:hypothetical protein
MVVTQDIYSCRMTEGGRPVSVFPSRARAWKALVAAESLVFMWVKKVSLRSKKVPNQRMVSLGEIAVPLQQ